MIEIDEALPFDGFTGVRDPLYARVVVLEDDAERFALVVLDQVSLSPDMVETVRNVVAQVGDLSPDKVAACVTRTFGADHVLPRGSVPHGEQRRHEAVRGAVISAVRAAASAARAELRPAQVGYGSGVSAVNVNREVLTADGWWHGVDDAGVRDEAVAVLRIDDLAGVPIAILVNYPVQSSVMHQSKTRDGGQLITADLAGAAVSHVEAQYAEANPVALFFIGCAADQGPFLSANRHVLDRDANWSREDLHEDGFLIVELLGERLGHEIVRVCEVDRGGRSRPGSGHGQCDSDAAGPGPAARLSGLAPVGALRIS